MGLQRNLKVMGIFARLCIRDKKSQYLADIPLVIQYFLNVSQHYPELAHFRDWFSNAVLPIAISKLPWNK
jgi:aminoglycoside/choline kinase family phosphotransferase